MDTAIRVAAGTGAGVVLVLLLALGFARRGRRPERRGVPTGRETAYVNLRRAYETRPTAERQRPEASIQPEPWSAPSRTASSRQSDAPRAVVPDSASGQLTEIGRSLEDPDPFVRIAVIGRLAVRSDAEALLGVAVHDEFPQVRREAVLTLAAIGGPRAARVLSDVVQHDPSAEVREEAVAALAALIEHRAADEGKRGG